MKDADLFAGYFGLLLEDPPPNIRLVPRQASCAGKIE
jgi:hypothetical protein